MFCKKCGKEIDEDSVYCSFCGTSVKMISNSGNSSTEKVIKEGQHQNRESISRAFPERYSYFNWGAWTLCWIYPFCNRLPGWGFLIIGLSIYLSYCLYRHPDSMETWLILIGYLILTLVFARNANKWAWENYPYSDGVEQFMKGQDKWNGWGIFFFIINLILGVVWFCFAVFLLGVIESF